MAMQVIHIPAVLVSVHLLLTCIVHGSSIPDLGVFQSLASGLDAQLKTFVEKASGIAELHKAYGETHFHDIKFAPVDGKKLVKEMAENLGAVLGKKMDALKKSVDWAEKIAAEYKWDGNVQLNDSEHVFAKEINESDPDYEYSSQFGQKVGFNASSIHVPVEIYRGDIDIQNGIAWTDKLSEIWRKNREDDPDLLWQYFGSQTGILRVYPASKWSNSGVDLYDVRRRPWYTQGASSPKDMFILIDTSGSTHGQALTLIKHSVKSLLDTLGENDFVNIAHFADKAKTVGCFDRLVQANYRNKKVLVDYVFNLSAKGMASYAKGFQFAFEQFEKFKHYEEDGEGANCNPIIMFLTDGGTEMPEEVFKTYNWPNKTIRIFSYGVGPIANPLAAVKWIACANRGYFYKIPAMGAIRSTVQHHIGFVAKGPALAGARWIRWSNIYLDAMVELPHVFSKKLIAHIDRGRYQKLLGSGLVGNQSNEFLWTNIYEDFWDYLSLLYRPKANDKRFSWTYIETPDWPITYHPKSSNSPFDFPPEEVDPIAVKGLGMMTSVTLPVYNTTEDIYKVESVVHGNQTILGVMGGDMTVRDMEAFTPYRKLGPNGYAFAINSNGYIVFHPNLKAKNGWLPYPPNVDFLDVEYNCPEREELRRAMIDNTTGEPGEMTFNSFALIQDEMHVDQKTRKYYYTGIPGSSFSLAIVVPTYAKFYLNGTTPLSVDEGVALLEPDLAKILIAPWKYCPGVESTENVTWEEALMDALSTDYSNCDETLVQHLLFDAKVTSTMDAHWQKLSSTAYDGSSSSDGIAAAFIATSGGLTRIYPTNTNESFEDMRDTWKARYYKRAFDKDMWVYSATHNTGITDFNASEPVVMATKAISLDGYKPAVVGVKITQRKLREFMSSVADCNTNICYLLDDAGFFLLSSDENDDLQMMVGQFFGKIDPLLMWRLYASEVFLRKEEYDYQATCAEEKRSSSAGIRSIFIPALYEILTLQWWTTKFAMLYVNFNIYSWLFSSPTDYAMASDYSPHKNYSCIKHLAQYYFSPEDDTDAKDLIECGNCTRWFATARLQSSNLLLVIATRDCSPPGDCNVPHLLQEPVETDPAFSEGRCNVTRYYRKRPTCNMNNDFNTCDGGTQVAPSVRILITVQLVVAALLMTRYS